MRDRDSPTSLLEELEAAAVVGVVPHACAAADDEPGRNHRPAGAARRLLSSHARFADVETAPQVTVDSGISHSHGRTCDRRRGDRLPGARPAAFLKPHTPDRLTPAGLPDRATLHSVDRSADLGGMRHPNEPYTPTRSIRPASTLSGRSGAVTALAAT